jgi:ribose transport system ATP-binding protein
VSREEGFTVEDEVPVLEGISVTKRFGGTTALRDVSIRLRNHEISGLVGENGAGKSTLMNIFTGVVKPDAGRILSNGEAVSLGGLTPSAQLARRIFRVYQELSLIPDLSVEENWWLPLRCLGSQAVPRRSRARREAVQAHLAEYGPAGVEPSQLVRSLALSTRQCLEASRCLFGAQSGDSVVRPVFLLDEPTSALSYTELQTLYRLLEAMREVGAVLFVSHRLSEVLSVCGQLHVLKDGELVTSVRAKETTEEGQVYREDDQCGPLQNKPILSLSDWSSRRGTFHNISLDVRPGEIVGVAGVEGSGKSALGASVIEAHPAAGRMAVAKGIRPAYLPGERLIEGIFGGLSVEWNLLYGNAHQLGRLIVRPRAVRRWVSDKIARYRIRGKPRDDIDALSGGNQQKVLIARVASRATRLLVLENPTRGVDAGAKLEIYGVIRRLAAEGNGILLISEDLVEVIGLADRILVMKDGRARGMIPSPPSGKPSEETVVQAMV